MSHRACCAHQLLCKIGECRLHSQECARALLPVPYDREVLVEVARLHYKTSIEGCTCGWSELGRDQGEHFADEYEKAVRARG